MTAVPGATAPIPVRADKGAPGQVGIAAPAAGGAIDYADRWMRDSLAVLRPAFSAYQITVDMTRALAALEALRTQGVMATTAHLLIRAAARSLARNPDLHVLVAGRRRERPVQVDIGLSVTGETFVAPVLVIEAADRKSVAEIAAETAERVPQVRLADRAMLARLRRWGWLVPASFARRAVLRALFAGPAYRRRLAGTFQISMVPVEWALSSVFVATGVLIAGPVRMIVVPVDGIPAVRPAMTLTLSSDHGVWDGGAAARFLAVVRSELEDLASI